METPEFKITNPEELFSPDQLARIENLANQSHPELIEGAQADLRRIQERYAVLLEEVDFPEKPPNKPLTAIIGMTTMTLLAKAITEQDVLSAGLAVGFGSTFIRRVNKSISRSDEIVNSPFSMNMQRYLYIQGKLPRRE